MKQRSNIPRKLQIPVRAVDAPGPCGRLVRRSVIGWHFASEEPSTDVYKPSLSFQSDCRGPRDDDRTRIQPGFSGRGQGGSSGNRSSARAACRAGSTDLRSLLWSSIDNDTSKDLDQIEWAEQLPDGRIRVLVGVADVDARVKKGSALDKHAPARPPLSIPAFRCFPCCRRSCRKASPR